MRTIQPHRKILTVEIVAEALLKYRGNMAAVGRVYGVSRQAVRSFVESHPQPLKQIRIDAVESLCDDVESALYNRAINGDTSACIFILKTLGRKRGWAEECPIHNITTEDLKKMNDEELRALLSSFEDDARNKWRH
jgi:hypothetical protein